MNAKTCRNTKKKSIVEPRQRLGRAAAAALLAELGDPWRLQKGELCGEWQLKNFSQTADLIRFVIRLSKQKNHHPRAEFGYRNVRVFYTTHSAGGLTRMDFDCAARISKQLQAWQIRG